MYIFFKIARLYIHYANLASVRFEYSVSRGSFMNTYTLCISNYLTISFMYININICIYIYIYIYIYIHVYIYTYIYRIHH